MTTMFFEDMTSPQKHFYPRQSTLKVRGSLSSEAFVMQLPFNTLRRAILLAAALLAAPSPAHAVDSATRAAARDLGYEGVQAYQGGDYQTATDRLERAYDVLRAPSLALWSARALEKTGKLVEASERYLEATRLPEDSGGDPAVQQKAKQEAAAERKELLPRIPKLVVEVDGVEARRVELTVAGESVKSALIGTPRPTNPGQVEVIGRVGNAIAKQVVTLTEGERESVLLSFDPSTLPSEVDDGSQQPAAPTATTVATPEDRPASGSWQRTAGWIGIAVGAAGVVVGGVTAGILAGKQGDLDCPDNVCPASQEDAMASYNNLRPVSSAAFVAGGILAAAGVTLLLTAPSAEQSASITPYVGWASAGVTGTF